MGDASFTLIVEAVEESGNKMERTAKLLLILITFLVVLVVDIEGGRRLEYKVDHPQSYFGICFYQILKM